MSNMNPCCGGSLQTGTKIIAILQLVLYILGVVVTFGFLVLTAGTFAFATSAQPNDLVHTKDESRRLIAAFGVGASIIGIFFIAVGILCITLSALLLSGANNVIQDERNRTRCMIWFVLHAIILVLSLVRTISEVFSEGEKSSTIAGGIFGNLILAYFLWVVWAFMSEIKEEGVEVEFQVPREGRGGPKTLA